MNKQIFLREYKDVLCFQTELQIYCKCEDIKKGHKFGFYLNIFKALYLDAVYLSFEEIAERFSTNIDKIKRFRRDIAKIAKTLMLSRLSIFKQGKNCPVQRFLNVPSLRF